MGKRITPVIGKKPVEIDQEKVILIIDSDEETEPQPKSKIPNPVFDVDAISIDLTEDDTPLNYKPPNRSEYIPPKSTTPPIIKRSVSTPTRETPRQTQSTPMSPKPTKSISNNKNVVPKKSSPFPERQQPQSPIKKTPNAKTFIADSKKDTPKNLNAIPNRQQPKSPNPNLRKVSSLNETSSPLTTDKSTFVLPQKWNSPSSLENRSSQASLAKLISSASPTKLSVPRSTLLKNSQSTVKRSSSMIKATSPVRKPSISASLKRPIESPERPSNTTSVFALPNRLSPNILSPNGSSPHRSTPPELTSASSNSRSPSIPISQSPEEQPICPGSPERKPGQNFEAFGSPEQRPQPPPTPAMDARRMKTSSSPFSRTPPKRGPSRTFYELDDDDDESEEDLGSFISVIDASRRRRVVNNAPKNLLSQCPLCYLMFPKNDLADHASDCNGEQGDDAPRIGQKRGIRKNTIAAAVEMDENERKRLNKGKIDMGPTNYYADSESILATDGTGLNAEVTGMSWESAGSTRFS